MTQAACRVSIALGFFSTIRNKARAGPVGRVRPCSQFWSVHRFTPMSTANCDWLKPDLRRIA